MEKIIAVDFDGTLVRNEPAAKAHEEWFHIMAHALHDESVKEYAGIKDYFPKVHEVMERYTGLSSKNEFDKKLLTQLARNLFQMSYIGMAHKLKDKILINDFAEYLHELKSKGYKIVLVTTAPEHSVKPILELTKSEEIFDIIYKSPLTSEPNKKELLELFVKENGKPLCYIGNSDDDVIACHELEIPCFVVTWDKPECKDTTRLATAVVGDIDKLKAELKKLSISS